MDLPIAEVAAALRGGSLTSADLVAEARARDTHGAYVHEEPAVTDALAASADAAFAAGLDLGPLHGLPVSVKDLYGVPGFPAAAGSPARLPEAFEAPGPLVSRALAQGAVVMGKTHTVEFAYGGIGTNRHHPTPRNPADVDPAAPRAPGGSSSGAGVSVGEGSALVAFGTDTAGSIRIPAAWTGNVGLKTTKGRWSTEGIVPLSATLDTPGVITRTVADQAWAFAALDPAGEPVARPARLGGVVLARPSTLFWEACAGGVVDAVDATLECLADAGARVVERDLPEVAPAYALFEQGGPVSTELYHFLTTRLPAWFDSLDPNVKARLDGAGALPAHAYLERLATMARLGTAARRRFDVVDAFVTPTVANSPPTLASLADPVRYAADNFLCLRNTGVVSYLGLCALTVPVGEDAVGMPVGLQLIGPPGGERRLLEIGLALETLYS